MVGASSAARKRIRRMRRSIADYVRTQAPPRWTPAPWKRGSSKPSCGGSTRYSRCARRRRIGCELAAAIVRPSIEATVAHLDAAITAIHQQIAAHIDQFPTLRRQRDLIVSIPGIGETTAAIVLGESCRSRDSPAPGRSPRLPGSCRRSASRARPVRGRGALSSSGRAACAKRCTSRRSPPFATTRRSAVCRSAPRRR